MVDWEESFELINFIGLIMDFVGFILLLREWWVAFLTQQRELELYQRRLKQDEMDKFRMKHSHSEALRDHLQTTQDMRDRAEAEKEVAEIQAALKDRRGLFFISALLIVLGTLMQIGSAIPIRWIPVDDSEGDDSL